MAVGIEALNVYTGIAQIPVATLFEGRGLDIERLDNLAMHNRSIGLPFEDPVTNAVNAAKPIIDALDPADRDAIEVLITSTESGLDLSKSVASYVHEYLGLSRNCRLLEVKQACYAATGAVQLAAGYLASAASPGAKALIIATDVALVDERAGYAEPATGHGAAAVLLGDRPTVLELDLGAFGLYSYETLDSARPTPEFDIADVDRSLFAYLDCLSGSFADYRSRVEGADFRSTFDQLAMHTPFSGLVRAGHRKLMRESGASAAEADADFGRRVRPSLTYPALVGNLCSGSVYLALASLLSTAPLTGSARVGLYSYGSGCSAEFFSGVVGDGSAAAVRAMDIGGALARRRELDFDEYARLLPENLRALVPVADREIDLDRWADYLPTDRPLLVHTRTKDYHRGYAWQGARP
ncbi:hydroxymethylglutaryl-CoA synthase [Streptomyces sp. 1114.5]|uniref:hydroxymethylglutaryl-CoA synthase family protein n=1 Tax=unclassified Streptomyces TaxID=2593676 RepID=UPI000BC4300A|nr:MULTISPECIES: hydroxymethylglutaryl-CoA synthase [unclassified Streptomyces]RKT17079.1 hydroxymethylglutaryl-CoA synthase [Streptomyces sp. 1114.5]SOB83289.1 hydroxymethylglutaryl-CoA synthase [Streptomyces sp. 1331.2]